MKFWLFTLVYFVLSLSLMAQTKLGSAKSLKEAIKKSCNNVRLDENPAMGTMIETRQVGGTCYAHAATTLYDAFRLRYPLKGQTAIKYAILSR